MLILYIYYTLILDYNGNAKANKVIHSTPLALYNVLAITRRYFALAR